MMPYAQPGPYKYRALTQLFNLRRFIVFHNKVPRKDKNLGPADRRRV